MRTYRDQEPLHRNGQGGNSDMMLGSMLGQLIGLHQQLVSLHHDANERLEAIEYALTDLPDRIAEKLPAPAAPSAPPPPTPEGVLSYMKTSKELIQAAVPLGLIVALVSGKASWPDVLPIIRQVLGVH